MKLEIRAINKTYAGDVQALNDFSLDLQPGVLGLVGPNGAGKTTLMNILATVTRPTGGTVLWDGVDIVKSPNVVRRVLGYLPQYFGVYPHLNAVEFLEYLAAVRGLRMPGARKRIDELLQLVNLAHAKKRPLASYSGGMRQRVGIAQALLNDPALLIVDEPTVGLDPEERIRFRNLLTELSGDRIVILSTHIVSDVEAAAANIAIINEGRLVHLSSPERLLGIVDGKVWKCVVPGDRLAEIRNNYLVSSTSRQADGVHLRIIAEGPPTPASEPVQPSLEDAYLHFVAGNRSIGI